MNGQDWDVFCVTFDELAVKTGHWVVVHDQEVLCTEDARTHDTIPKAIIPGYGKVWGFKAVTDTGQDVLVTWDGVAGAWRIQ